MQQINPGVGRKILMGALCSLLLVSGCSEDSGSSTSGASREGASATKPDSSTPAAAPTPSEPGTPTRTPEELAAAGRSVYMANCIACHSMNPAQDGALGPAVAGASLALLEARVLRGEYPEGYVPKRPSRVMIPLPHLEPKLPELAWYLESLESLE